MLHGINHMALPVRNLEVSDRFYRGILGLCLVGERPGMKFYTAGLHHHDLALTRVAEELNNRPRKSLGFRTPAEVMTQQIRQLSCGAALQT